MMIGPNHEITADRFNWMLTEWTDGKDKDGNPKRRGHTTFHGTLEQACQSILNRSAADKGADSTAQDVINAIFAAGEMISTEIRNAGVTKEAANGG